MVRRQEGSIWFLCDRCADSIDTEEDDFQEAVAVMRGAGWSAKPLRDGDWLHTCPSCQPPPLRKAA